MNILKLRQIIKYLNEINLNIVTYIIDTLFIKVQLNFIPKHQSYVDNHKLLVSVQ